MQPDTGTPSSSTVQAPQTPIPHVARADVQPSRSSSREQHLGRLALVPAAAGR